MQQDPANIYESEDSKLTQETERLSSFDLPNQISIDAIGAMNLGEFFLDVGAGPNISLFKYVSSRGGIYTALDKNDEFLEKQRLWGADTVKGDVRALPFDSDSFDIVHARFVIAHLGNDKQKGIKSILRVVKSGGRALFIDFDWATASGSDVFEKVKNYMINGGFLFDADFGSTLEQEVKKSGVHGAVSVKSYPPTPMKDYSQVLKLREAGSTDLKVQGRDDTEWNSILDELQKESESANPPGFNFPGVKLVVLTKDK